MKKSMILLGMLSIGYAYAQEGNVGINTEDPKATLDIQPNSTNLAGTTNEGLLIPRLSKDRVAKMTTPAVSTLVYVNEFASYTGSDAKVVDIDTVGFYHYNGTKWVKHIDTDTNTSIWSKVNRNITLFDSDLDNAIKYTTEGQYWNIPKELRKASYFDASTLTTITSTIDFDNDINQIGQAGNVYLGYADKLFTSNTANSLWKGKKLVSNFLLVDEKNDATTVDRLYTQTNALQTNENATKNYSALYSQVNSVEHYGSGRANMLIGTYSNSGIIKGSAGRIVGAYNQAGTQATSTTNIIEGTYNMLNPRSSSTINGLYGTRDNIILDRRSSNKIGIAVGSHSVFDISADFTGTITEAIGTYLHFVGVKKEGVIKDMYGLRITDVNKGTGSNYAIYTGAGKVRVGDLADTAATTDRAVVVDKNGILKVGVATASTATNGVQNTADMPCNEDNRGKMNFVKGADGKSDIFGICMKNKDGNYYWGYMVGGNNPTNGSGAFGSGL